ncbi:MULTISPECIES: helix-turn-helix domain-containing protein [Bacillales]|uniref:helix-turn-helix domain-containing protein n=1 Tax=Bacillales TaxID=1385 RepID=UPI001586B307|nr:XRE family transcriptional regulator [Bacillus sp. FJAT-27264]
MLDNIQLIFAKNLKALRNQRKLSLDKVSELTGISKTMLGQIERGESNPSITTVWKIANGLKVSFTALINQSQTEAVVVAKEDIQSLTEEEKYRLYPFFPYDDGRKFEIYTVDIDPGGELISEPHQEGTEEYITVFEGEMTVLVGGTEYKVKAGDAIRFKADRPHSYFNRENTKCQMNMVIYYGGNH